MRILTRVYSLPNDFVVSIEKYLEDLSIRLETCADKPARSEKSERNQTDTPESIFDAMNTIKTDQTLRPALKNPEIARKYSELRSKISQRAREASKRMAASILTDLTDQAIENEPGILEDIETLARLQKLRTSAQKIRDFVFGAGDVEKALSQRIILKSLDSSAWMGIPFNAARFIAWQICPSLKNDIPSSGLYKKALQAQAIPVLGMIPSALMALVNTLGIVQKVAERAFYNFRWAISYVRKDIVDMLKIEKAIDINTETLRRLSGLVANSVTNFFTAGLLNFAASLYVKQIDLIKTGSVTPLTDNNGQ